MNHKLLTTISKILVNLGDDDVFIDEEDLDVLRGFIAEGSPSVKLLTAEGKQMKNETVVNGVTLTRDQVEKAMADLNTPVDLSVDCTKGKLVQSSGSFRLELGGASGQLAIETALGVAPPGFSGKCLWLSEYWNKWEYREVSGYKVVIPTRKP